jgi:hypothetical protein
MNEQITTSASSNMELERLKRRIKILIAAIIGILLLVIISVVYYYYKTRPNSVGFITEVPDNTAIDGTDNFKKVVSFSAIKDCRGVLFSQSEIENYLTNYLPNILSRHAATQAQSGGDIPNGYNWKIAFCWTIRNDPKDKQDKLTYYITPMLTDGTHVLDYFRVDNNKYYNHPLGSADAKNIYDEGQLWP